MAEMAVLLEVAVAEKFTGDGTVPLAAGALTTTPVADSVDSVVQDSTAAFTFGGTLTTGHGNGIDIQEDGNNNHTYPVTYDKINVVRW